jgi:hypothetical protein
MAVNGQLHALADLICVVKVPVTHWIKDQVEPRNKILSEHLSQSRCGDFIFCHPSVIYHSVKLWIGHGHFPLISSPPNMNILSYLDFRFSRLWRFKSCSDSLGHQRFGWPCCLHFQESKFQKTTTWILSCHSILNSMCISYSFVKQFTNHNEYSGLMINFPRFSELEARRAPEQIWTWWRWKKSPSVSGITPLAVQFVGVSSVSEVRVKIEGHDF